MLGTSLVSNVAARTRSSSTESVPSHADPAGPDGVTSTSGSEVRAPQPPVIDDFLVEVREGAAPELSFDRAIVSELDVARVEILSLVLAQSVAMDYYDEDVELMYRRIDEICLELARRGRFRFASYEM